MLPRNYLFNDRTKDAISKPYKPMFREISQKWVVGFYRIRFGLEPFMLARSITRICGE